MNTIVKVNTDRSAKGNNATLAKKNIFLEKKTKARGGEPLALSCLKIKIMRCKTRDYCRVEAKTCAWMCPWMCANICLSSLWRINAWKPLTCCNHFGHCNRTSATQSMRGEHEQSNLLMNYRKISFASTHTHARKCSRARTPSRTESGYIFRQFIKRSDTVAAEARIRRCRRDRQSDRRRDDILNQRTKWQN